MSVYCICECVFDMAWLRNRCELIRGFAGGRDEHPKIDGWDGDADREG